MRRVMRSEITSELFSGAGECLAGTPYPFSRSFSQVTISCSSSNSLDLTSVTNKPVLGGEGFEEPAWAGLKDFEVEFLREKRRNPVARLLISKRNLEV